MASFIAIATCQFTSQVANHVEVNKSYSHEPFHFLHLFAFFHFIIKQFIFMIYYSCNKERSVLIPDKEAQTLERCCKF